LRASFHANSPSFSRSSRFGALPMALRGSASTRQPLRLAQRGGEGEGVKRTAWAPVLRA
jgi:hypothetical protein